MPNEIERRNSAPTATILNGAALSGPIEMSQYAGGTLQMPAAWTAASIAFQTSETLSGTYQPLYTTANALVEVTAAAGRNYPLPDQLFGCKFVKLWSESAGVGVNQGADRAIVMTLKG